MTATGLGLTSDCWSWPPVPPEVLTKEGNGGRCNVSYLASDFALSEPPETCIMRVKLHLWYFIYFSYAGIGSKMPILLLLFNNVIFHSGLILRKACRLNIKMARSFSLRPAQPQDPTLGLLHNMLTQPWLIPISTIALTTAEHVSLVLSCTP